MTNIYSNSKIYKIEPICDHEENEIYIGSTTKKYLSQRMNNHRHNYKAWKNNTGFKTSSFILFDKYGVDNCKIYLLETVNVNSRDELRAIEGNYIKTLPCINRCVAGRTQFESMREFILSNPNYFQEYSKKYREVNSDKIKINKKEYYKTNRNLILIKQKTKKLCDCGCEYTISNKTNHCKTRKHQEIINNFL